MISIRARRRMGVRFSCTSGSVRSTVQGFVGHAREVRSCSLRKGQAVEAAQRTPR